MSVTIVGESMEVTGSQLKVTAQFTVSEAGKSVGTVVRTYSTGKRLPDGTVFAGISPETNGPMFAMVADGNVSMNFNAAAEYAVRQNVAKAYGHNDWRVPTDKELHVLFNNRAAVGGLNLNGSLVDGWYWSSSACSPNVGAVERMSDGKQSMRTKDFSFPVRLVRSPKELSNG